MLCSYAILAFKSYMETFWSEYIKLQWSALNFRNNKARTLAYIAFYWTIFHCTLSLLCPINEMNKQITRQLHNDNTMIMDL